MDTIVLQNGCAYLYLNDDSFTERSAQIREAVTAMASSSLLAALIVDCQKLEELDMDSIAGLIHLQKHMMDEGSLLSLRNVSPAGMRILEYMKLDDFFHVQSDASQGMLN